MPDAAIQWIVFPMEAMISGFVHEEAGRDLEIGLVGAEGMVGLAQNFALFAALVLARRIWRCYHAR